MAEFVGSIGSLVLVLCVNGALLMSQVTMGLMAGGEGSSASLLYADNGSVMCQTGRCDVNGVPLGTQQNWKSNIPTSQGGSYSTGGSTFTDLWNTLSGWVVGAGSFLFGMIAAPVTFLMSVGLVGSLAPFAFIVGIIWSGFSVLVIINFIRGN